MDITRIAFWSMLGVAAIEIYELVRYADASIGSVLMLVLSLAAAAWLHFDERRNPSGV